MTSSALNFYEVLPRFRILPCWHLYVLRTVPYLSIFVFNLCMWHPSLYKVLLWSIIITLPSLLPRWSTGAGYLLADLWNSQLLLVVAVGEAWFCVAFWPTRSALRKRRQANIVGVCPWVFELCTTQLGSGGACAVGEKIHADRPWNHFHPRTEL